MKNDEITETSDTINSTRKASRIANDIEEGSESPSVTWLLKDTSTRRVVKERIIAPPSDPMN
jgi:hypothetical protein